MNLNKKFISQALMVIFVATPLSVLPLKAVSESHPLEGILGPKREDGGGRSWEEIQTIFLNRSNRSNPFERPKSPGTSRSGDRGNTGFCPVSPQSWVDKDQNNPENIDNSPVEIWSNQPLFIWQDNNIESTAVVVSSAQGSNQMWSQEVDTEDNFILYNNATPLQAGETYQWHLLQLDSQIPTNSAKVNFKIMEADKRAAINQELQEIEQQLEGESAEKIALEKANYFIRNGFWSDALQVMFLVNNPSEELKQAINRIKSHDFCQVVTDSTSESF